MIEKRSPKKRKIREMEKIISDILIVGDHDLKPYIEMFNYEPENVTQKSLGKLLGFFEIKDENEDSAYIVNFLASVIKKEYFINTKRGPIESFESSLNKINLALSEIAKHGNVNWLGKLDSAICAIEGNNLHFSVSGNGKVLLMRNGNLTEISQGLSETENTESGYLNPMKTFVNVSSGRFENGDKIIITTDDIFHIFSLNELKKGALQFSREKFVQFIKTALINELDIAGTIIIDVCKKIELPKEDISLIENEPTKEEELNVFSQKTFEEKNSKKYTLKYKNSPDDAFPKNSEEKNEYIDKKTGHIYLKEDAQDAPTQKEKATIIKEYANEKFSNCAYWIKNDCKKWIIQATKKSSTKLKEYQRLSKNASILAISQWKEKRLKQKELADQISKEKFSSSLVSSSASTPHSQSISITKEQRFIKPNFSTKLPRLFNDLKSTPKFIFLFFAKIKTRAEFLLPNFRKIAFAIRRMNYSQKIYSLLIILSIIFIPLVFRNYQDNSSQSKLPDITNETPTLPIMSEKNMRSADSLEKIFSTEESPKSITESEGRLFSVLADSIIEMDLDQKEKSKTFPLPDSGSKAEDAVFMPDLDLILILTDQKKIMSFSTISKKFQETNFTIPENSKIEGMATYMTYLYILDSINNQVYFYPRAEGGFSEKEPRIKDNIDIQELSNLTIDENIYIANGGRIEKFFMGKKIDITLEQSETPINNDIIFTSQKNNFIYSIDKNNGRLIKFSKQGEISAQYYTEKIKMAENFVANDNDTKIYISMPDGIYQLDISI
jgi:hypothetical protein